MYAMKWIHQDLYHKTWVHSIQSLIKQQEKEEVEGNVTRRLKLRPHD